MSKQDAQQIANDVAFQIVKIKVGWIREGERQSVSQSHKREIGEKKLLKLLSNNLQLYLVNSAVNG